MQESNVPEVFPLDLQVTDEMRYASMALCSLKYLMDTQSRTLAGQPFINDWMEEQRGTCAFFGHSFLRVVVPFLDWETPTDSKPRYKAHVDTLIVLGACINGFPHHIESDKVAAKIHQYTHELGSCGDALYIWYKPLGIFVAHEGKHRVAFMRTHRQPAIAAWIDETNYPAAERLKLISLQGENEWLALLDHRYLQVIKRPCTTRAYLRAYGVEEVRWSDLDDMPDESAVRQHLQLMLCRTPKTIREIDRTIDIHDIRKMSKENIDIEEIRVNLLQIPPYRFAWHAFVRDVGILMLLSVVVLSTAIPYSETVGVGLMGVATGMTIMGTNKRIIAVRQRLQNRSGKVGIRL